MLCFEDAPVVATFLSLLGSVLLVWPVWHASQMLKTAFKLSKTTSHKESSFDEGIKATAAAIEDDAGKWTPGNHYQLVGGIGFMVVGGLISLIDACCKAACVG